jgi:hypothetical protein
MVLPVLLVGVAGVAWAARVGVVRYRAHLERLASIPAIDKVKAAYKGPFEAKMTPREARLILNIQDGAEKKAIADAHRKLMMLNHPDSGGSPLLAAKVNEAKDLLQSPGARR